ncbi:MAG: serine/threonine-protein kinase [Actinomycetota bacterium]
MNSTEWQKIKDIFGTTLDLPASERAGFLETCADDLRREVEKLLKANDEANDFIVEPAFIEVGLKEADETDFYVGKQIDNYRILKEIGHGGMGTVYLASRVDKTFDKKVAIKLIKRGMDTSAVLKRFVMERKILAQLENPNIANLLDGGSTADGLPYLVMEYIEGLPITKFCDARKFSIEERLELFRKVCAAVSYAHQNLIVHRDIKPSNILVMEDSNVKLLDFGIAKLLHPDWSVDAKEATATMFRVMTPEYASPEQIRGLPITTASDVYSLGVVLYELLSGERPFKLESRLPEEVAQIILTEEPVRPSAISNFNFQISNSSTKSETNPNNEQQTTNDEQTSNPKSKIPNPRSLRGDLDNIILKSLRKEPERRYQSVQEFSEDIRRHLVGLPVTATADTTFYRIGKFIKRHRTGVFAGVLMLFTILSATAITTWQAIVAKREQAKTQHRFNQVRKLANTVLFDYHERIKEMPGATEVREKMVTDSLEYLDNLSAESSEDTDLQRELALAYRKVGDIEGDIAFGTSLGKTEAALASYRKALAIQEKIVAANPLNIDDRRTLARLMLDIAGQHEFTGDSASRENYTRGAIEIFQQIVEKVPNETKSHSDLARALWQFASAVRAQSDLENALVSYRQSAEIYEKLAAENPAERKFIRNAALTYKNMGGVFEQKKDFAAALELYQKALLIDTKNAEEEPDNVTSQLDLSFSYGSISDVSYNTENFKAALENCRKKQEIQEKIVAADAKNFFAQTSLAGTYQQLAAIWEKIENFEAAFDNYQKAVKMFEKLSAAEPANVKSKLDLAKSYTVFGKFISNSADRILAVREKLNRLREAQILQMRGLDIFQALKTQNTLDKADEAIFTDARNWQQKTEDQLAKLSVK